MIEAIADSTSADDERLQAAYDMIVPSDNVVVVAFQRRFHTTPADFDPV